MERNTNTIDLAWLAVRDRLERRTFIEAGLRDAQAITRNQIAATSTAKMVCVCVCDDRSIDRSPWVDEKTSLLAEQAIVRDTKQWVYVQIHATIIRMTWARRSTLYIASLPNDRGINARMLEFDPGDQELNSPRVIAGVQ
jgi:hypothetical protein